MDIEKHVDGIHYYLQTRNGQALADLLSLRDDHVDHILKPSDKGAIVSVKIKQLPQLWSEIVLHHINAVLYQSVPNWERLYQEQYALAALVVRIMADETTWCLPIIYMTCKQLRNCAILADLELSRRGSKTGKLEEAARVINKAFTVCLSDRNPLEISRKWGTYYIIGLLFKTYFKLKSTALCRNVLRAITVTGLPPLELYPIAHQVTYRVHMGMLAFLDENYERAEIDLAFAFANTPKSAVKNRAIILDYLVPTLMTRGILPGRPLLKKWPKIACTYGPIIHAIRKCHVGYFDKALSRAQAILVESGTYLTVEKSRKLCVRRLIRLVWVLADRPSRIDVKLFRRAFNLAGLGIDDDGVECILANMIYDGHVRGYLSRDQHKIVLSAKDPFPKLHAKPG